MPPGPASPGRGIVEAMKRRSRGVDEVAAGLDGGFRHAEMRAHGGIIGSTVILGMKRIFRHFVGLPGLRWHGKVFGVGLYGVDRGYDLYYYTILWCRHVRWL